VSPPNATDRRRYKTTRLFVSPLPATFAHLDALSQRQLRRDAEALGITAEALYTAILERRSAERVNASAVADALAAARSRTSSATRSDVV